MDIKKNLGKKIRELRQLNSLTQEALAEKINISSKSLSQIECGNNFVSAETLDCICSALNTTPKKLFDYDYSLTNETESIKDITDRLSKKPQLLKMVYKIVLALDS